MKRQLLLLLTMIACAPLTGCALMGAVTNPSMIWAVTESTPMSLVVRRAEVARGVADGVEHLIDAPVDGGAAEALAMKQADGQKLLELTAAEPIYANAVASVRIMPAEAWLVTVSQACDGGEGATLIELLDGDVAEQYREVAAQGRKVAAKKAEIAACEQKAEAEGASEAEKARQQERIEALEKEIEKLEEDHEPAVAALLESVRTQAAATDAEARARMAPVVAHLLAAVEGASEANAAAALGYPMAVPGLKDDVTVAAKRLLADVIEEQTGSRPDMTSLTPKVELEGLTPKLSLAGVPVEKIGDIDPEELVVETTERLIRYAELTATLLGYVEETAARLDFYEEVLSAWSDGIEAAAPEIDLEALASTPGTAATEDAVAVKGRSIGGLPPSACQLEPRADEPVVAAAPPASVTESTEPKVSDPKIADAKAAAPKVEKPRGAPPKRQTAAAKRASSPASPPPQPTAGGVRYRDLPGQSDVPQRIRSEP